MPMWSDEMDLQLRREAMAWLAALSSDGDRFLSSEEIGDFRFAGQPFALMDRQRGIRKPAVLSAALSIRTTFRPEGAPRPYDDRQREDGLITYKWRGTDADHPENRGLRAAFERRLPLIWFVGLAPSYYQPVFPVFIVEEQRQQHQFVLSPLKNVIPTSSDSAAEEVLRQYVTTEAKRRLHQPIFRGMVMRAYGERCAVCSLGHSTLLDAAHIVPDADERGVASVRNGLALCKIHHAAYDNGILGIRPDYGLEVRLDILHEVDGPMLRHGIQEMHGDRLRVVPDRPTERPDPSQLEQRWESFRAS